MSILASEGCALDGVVRQEELEPATAELAPVQAPAAPRTEGGTETAAPTDSPCLSLPDLPAVGLPEATQGDDEHETERRVDANVDTVQSSCRKSARNDDGDGDGGGDAKRVKDEPALPIDDRAIAPSIGQSLCGVSALRHAIATSSVDKVPACIKIGPSHNLTHAHTCVPF